MQFLLRRSPDDGRIMFPGSQPVSLARTNLNMLRDRRGSYMVTRISVVQLVLALFWSHTFAASAPELIKHSCVGLVR